MDIHQSIDELLESEEVVGQVFYEILLAKYPTVQAFFGSANLARQAFVLTMTLLLVKQYDTYRYPAIARYLRDLGESHRARQIPAELFSPFREALLEALARYHGSKWNEVVHHQWNEAIGRAARVMLEAYPDGRRPFVPLAH